MCFLITNTCLLLADDMSFGACSDNDADVFETEQRGKDKVFVVFGILDTDKQFLFSYGISLESRSKCSST